MEFSYVGFEAVDANFFEPLQYENSRAVPARSRAIEYFFMVGQNLGLKYE